MPSSPRSTTKAQAAAPRAAASRARKGARPAAEAEAAPAHGMTGQSPVMQQLYSDIARVAPTRASVLITGESGTGKELVSRAIHRLSARAMGPFVRVNCAAIAPGLVESELFGHERGAFTGAEDKRRGLFEQAHEGTLFLDEIGDMDLAAQSKLLRALEAGEVSRLGSETAERVDVRVVAATNKDIAQEVRAGRFREDLFFRLSVFPIQCPALRERPEDVRALADAFLVSFCQGNGLGEKSIDPAVYAALERRRFPGNVRELRNVIERAAILADSVVTLEALREGPREREEDSAEQAPAAPAATPVAAATPAEPAAATAGAPSQTSPGASAAGRPMTLREFRDQCERQYIIEVLARTGWNISRAAKLLEVERANLHRKIRVYGLKRGDSANRSGG